MFVRKMVFLELNVGKISNIWMRRGNTERKQGEALIMSKLEVGHSLLNSDLTGASVESKAPISPQKKALGTDDVEELAQSIADLAEEAGRMLTEAAQVIHSMTAVMEQIQPQVAAAAKAAQEVRELADATQERAKSARTWSIVATIASAICTGLAVVLLILLIHVQS